MKELLQHLKDGRFSELFPDGEFTNATNLLYTALLCAVDDSADELVIKQNGFEWSKNAKNVGAFLGGGTPIPTPSFNVIVSDVLRHDELVKKHMSIKHEDSERTVIDISQ